MDDAALEYLDLDAELQVALPKDGKDYLRQFGGLQAPDLWSTLSGTYYEGVPLDENPEAIFDVLSRESWRCRDQSSSVKESRENGTGSALITGVTSSEDSDSSVKARDATQNCPRVIGRAEKRHQNPEKRVSFHDDSPGKENEKLDPRKAQDKKSKFFPQRNEKNERSPTKDNALHTPEKHAEKSPKKAKGLKFSGFSKLLHKRNDEKFHKHSTPRNALPNRSHAKYDESIANTTDNNQVYNTIGDIDFENDALLDLDSKDYSFEDVTEIEVCYGATHTKDGGTSASSNSRRTSSGSSGRSEDNNATALYSNVSVFPTSQTLLAIPSEVQDVVEILSTEPSHDDVTNRKRHLAINSNILKLQEPLPSAVVGNVEKLRMFVDSLSRDTILRTADEEGQTALHLAVFNGHLDCVILLCSKFPEMLQRESKGKLTPSSLAIKAGKIEILDWLIEHTSVSKEFSSTKQRRSLVHQAAKFGQDGCLRLLLEKLQSRGVVKEPLDFAGNTPAHLAAKYGHLICLQTLVEYGRDVCLANQSDVTPFQCALAGNHRHCAAYLVAIHSNKQLARKLAVKSALVKKYEEDRRILRAKHRELLLDMTRECKPSQSQRDHHGNLAEILDHVVTQMEDLYIENSALRQRFNGAKKGSFVLRDDVKAMLAKLKTLRQELEGTQDAGFTSTSVAWQRLEELQRHTDDVTGTLPSGASLENAAWDIQRISFEKVNQEMYHTHKKKKAQSYSMEAPIQDDAGQIELYVSHENLTNGESFRSKRRRRSRTSQSRGNALQNDLENSGKISSRGHDLIARSAGHLGDDINDNTYDELSNMSTYRSSYSVGGVVDHFASPYEALCLASSDANVIEITENASEGSIDLPNGSLDDVEDDIDAMDSVSQVGDDNRERSQSLYWDSSRTTMPDLTVNALPGSLSFVDNDLDRTLDGAKRRLGITNEESLNSGLPYSLSTRNTKEVTFLQDESRKQGPAVRTNYGSQRAVIRSHISGAEAEKAFEQSENIPRKQENLRDWLCGAEEISRTDEGDTVGFTAVLCGTDKEHISKGHEMLAAEEELLAHPLSGRPTLSSARSSLDLEDKRSSLLRDIQQDTEDILMALGSNPPEDIEPVLPSDGSLRIPPSMQFEMRLSTIEEASVVSGSLPCDDEEEEVDSDDDDGDDEQDDDHSSILPGCASRTNQLEDRSQHMAATEFSGDEKPWYENSDEDDVTTWRPRREQHGREEHLTLL